MFCHSEPFDPLRMITAYPAFPFPQRRGNCIKIFQIKPKKLEGEGMPRLKKAGDFYPFWDKTIKK
ncbi:MAG: hypothetical protein RBG1_1C00001G0139 [candidate division Zixibacteria bacterium RBG-1]|nr:MAG: hypothetical protein RBG1_1C00001G0139 [candidate division Zixibacteria bacterium RBG-1]OGC85381.1 MAG: hypothetical protein A2V73_08695 [candidate division Zixibacteria bacterium RBG_19FT_COMBO_42_43]